MFKFWNLWGSTPDIKLMSVIFAPDLGPFILHDQWSSIINPRGMVVWQFTTRKGVVMYAMHWLVSEQLQKRILSVFREVKSEQLQNRLNKTLCAPVKWRAMDFRERGHGWRGVENRGGNEELLEEIRRMQTILEALEVNWQQDLVGRDIDDNEEEPEEEIEPKEDHEEVILLKSVIGASMRPKPEVPTYKGGLDANELLDWITRWTSSLIMMRQVIRRKWNL